ncbi:MAG: hypothetical protein IKQ60_09855 [Candidatus Methanomethylophilaceae archaeon]|nr:hypothetical protein [Candidatus Methanomethylophilaceae archaeon]
MTFFDNTRMLGIIFWAVGIMMVLESILMVVSAFTDFDVDLPDEIVNITAYQVAFGAGSLVTAVLYIFFANRVMRGNMTDKIGLLGEYIIMVGATSIVRILVELIALVAGELTIEEVIVYILMFSVMAVFFIAMMAVGRTVLRGREARGKGVLWVVLFIAFVVMAAYNLTEAETELVFISHINHLLIAIFMLLALLDPEVMSRMGVRR